MAIPSSNRQDPFASSRALQDIATGIRALGVTMEKILATLQRMEVKKR